jgi:hypothetical protein
VAGRNSSRMLPRKAIGAATGRLHEDKAVEFLIVGVVVVLSVATWLVYRIAAGLRVKK